MEWIRVEDRLPDESGVRCLVLVHHPSHIRPMVEIANHYKHRIMDNTRKIDPNFLTAGVVTYWMPLPDTPE